MQSSLSLRSSWRQAGIFLAVLLKAIKLPRLLVGVLLPLAAILAVPLPAQAQAQMLFLSTTETQSTGAQEINNAWEAFSVQATNEGLTPENGLGLLSGTAPLPITADTKLIVIVTGYSTVSSVAMAQLQAAIETNPSLAIVIFSESCSSTSGGGGLSTNCANSQHNLQGFMAAVNTIQPQPPTWPLIELGAGVSASNYTARLNPNSLYASTFAGLGNLLAGNYTPLINVPLNYALYTQTVLPTPPPSIVTQNVVGLFIPQAASNNGTGACLFLTADASEFSNATSHLAQFTPIAKAFTTAALDPDGACAQPVAGAPDLWPTLSDLSSLTVNSPAEVTLTVTNADQSDSETTTTVTVNLPSGVVLNGPLPAGCSTTMTGFTCDVPELVAGNSASFPFQIVAQTAIDAAVGAQITAEVAPVPNEINTGNNSTELPIVAPGDVDLGVAISSPPTRLVVASSHAYWVTVTNEGTLESDDGTVTVTLPSGLTIDAASLPSNCEVTSATSFTCTLSEIAPGKSVTIAFTATPAQTFADQPIQAQLTGVSGDSNEDNDNAEMTVSAVAAGFSGSPAPIPALGTVALALLALLVAGGAAAGWRRKG